MKVKLINFTQDAVNLLIYTKQTRLTQGEKTREKIAAMSEEEKMKELSYMADTIPSSWEFVDYVFEITEVTRAFTHQFVRTRTGSYAQQTMRLLEKENFTFATGPTIREMDQAGNDVYRGVMHDIQKAYDWLIANGAAVEDARGLLPTNIHTNIIAKFNLRTVAELARSRTGGRTQGEYQDVAKAMIGAVLEVHPWAYSFLFPDLLKKAAELELMFEEQRARGFIDQAHYLRALKIVDMFKKRI